MSNFIVSPNMGLPVATPGIDPGPDYATNEQSCFNTIDLHDHSPGKGVPIGPNGMDINSDLPINGNNLTSVKTVRFSAQGAPISALSPNLGCVYVSGNELYYNDEAGNVVQVTNNGSVNAGAGSITGLPSGTASASFSSISKTFTWRSSTSTAAIMDGSSYIFREQVANANGVKLSSPTSLASDYEMFWPAGLPISVKMLTVDNTGSMGDSYWFDGTSIQAVSNVVSVKTITNTNIVDNTISTGKLTRTITTFTSNGSYTVPAGVNYIRILATGGGGGGGGGGNAVFASRVGGGGGGGGQIFEGVLAVNPGDVHAVVIGAGGAGGGSNSGPPSSNGSVGANTTFGAILTVLGGNGGLQASTGGAGQPGSHAGQDGQAGSGSGSTDTTAGIGYLLTRQSGAGGAGAAVTNGVGGAGGGSYGSGGNGGANVPGSVQGTNAAANTGGGGGGGVGGPLGGQGGTGGSGILIVYEI